MSAYDFPYELEYVASYEATLSEPEIIGPVAEGMRANFYVTGGTLRGPRLNGKLRPVGADWLTVRTDGVAVLDVRATFETDDGALIYVSYGGMIDMGPDGYRNFIDGNPPPPEGVDIRMTPKFQTSHPDYLWLNRAVCVGIGKGYLDQSRVCYDVYEVT
jgi:hypothetical protein